MESLVLSWEVNAFGGSEVEGFGRGIGSVAPRPDAGLNTAV